MTDHDDHIVIHERTLLAQGWGRLESYEIEHDDLSGGRGRHVREVYDHGSAAAILLHDPDSGLVALTRQFRLPPHLNGESARLIEICAGLLDGDEPEVCARREAEEETGYRPSHMRFVCAAYASPGSLTEKTHCFIGRYTSQGRHGARGGLASEGEDIEVIEMALEAALEAVAAGRIVDAKTILMLYWLALNRNWSS